MNHKNKAIQMFFLSMIAILVLALSACEKENINKGYEEIDGVLHIETPYCVLHYPAEWKEYLETEYTANFVKFYATINDHEKRHLFDVIFGEEIQDPFGTIQTKDGKSIQVAFGVYPLDLDETWAEEDAQILSGMLDDLNYLVDAMSITESIPVDMSSDLNMEYEDIVIETPYGILYYPGKWEQYLRIDRVENDGAELYFYATIEGKEDIHLFDLILQASQEGEYCVMTEEDGTVITLQYVPVPFNPDSSWSQEQTDIVIGMQESSNYLLNRLTRYEPAAEDVVVETRYVNLHFPGILKDVLQVEIQSGKKYVVTILAPDGLTKLYDIVLGPNLQTEYGGIRLEDRSFIGVDVVFYPVEMDANWSDEEINTIYALLEASDYVLENLPFEREDTTDEDVYFARQEAEGNPEPVSTLSTAPESTEDLEVNTPYGVLRYPGKWNGQVEYETHSDNGFQVDFYAIVEEERIQLFAISFGSGEGIRVGTVSDASGETIDVNVTFFEIDPNVIRDPVVLERLYAMQEDVNYLLNTYIE